MGNEAMTLDELADACEKATGPDHKLSGDIAYAVGTYQAPDRGSPDGYWPHYTASLDAAKTLYVRVPERVPSNPRLATAEALRARIQMKEDRRG